MEMHIKLDDEKYYGASIDIEYLRLIFPDKELLDIFLNLFPNKVSNEFREQSTIETEIGIIKFDIDNINSTIDINLDDRNPSMKDILRTIIPPLSIKNGVEFTMNIVPAFEWNDYIILEMNLKKMIPDG